MIHVTQKNQKSFLLFMLSVSMLVYGIVADGLASTGSVEIEIVRALENGKEPVEGVKAKLLEGKGDKTFINKSDNDGVCTFQGLPTGNYFLYLYSSKFKKKYKEWALPVMNKKVEIRSGDNKFSIVCKKAATIKGTLKYQGNGDIQKATINSWGGQQNTKPNENGRFSLSGLHPDFHAKILISILYVDSKYTPLYQKIIDISKDELNEGEITDVGKVEIPRAKKNEHVRILVLNRDGKELDQYRSKDRSHELFIEREKGDVLFKGFVSNLGVMKRSSAGDGAKLRLPSGKYRAWWRGYKDTKIYSFKITEETQPTLKVKLPDK